VLDGNVGCLLADAGDDDAQGVEDVALGNVHGFLGDIAEAQVDDETRDFFGDHALQHRAARELRYREYHPTGSVAVTNAAPSR
jgi:hypothetical protein